MPTKVDVRSLDPSLRRLIEAAVRAPSGDNCQPWEFHFDNPSRIRIRTLPDRAKSFFDYSHHGTLLSLGAVIENIRIQARAEGLVATLSALTGPIGETTGAEAVLDLSKDSGLDVDDDMIRSIYARTVNRRAFLPIRPSRKKLEAILADPLPGVRTSVISKTTQIAKWARLVYLADRIRYSHPVIHNELFSKILFTKKMAETRGMGLEIDRLGAGPAAKPLMQFLQPWNRMENLLRYGIDRLLAAHSRFLALTTGVLVLLTIENDTPRKWVCAGERMERIWLRAQQEGLRVHPMTVVLYLDQRYQQEGIDSFFPRHKPYLDEIRAILSELIPEQTGTMLFRLGYGWRMRHTAIRMPIKDFLSE